MSDQDAFDRILASLYTAILDNTHWPAASALIDEACGSKGNTLMVSEGPKDAIQVFCAGLYYRGERRTDLEHEYFTVHHAIDERVPRFRQLPDSRLVHTPDLYIAKELQTSRTYNELLSKSHAQDGLNVRLDGPSGSSIALNLCDPVTRGGWGSTQVALLTELLPHIRQFVRIRHTLTAAEALGTAVTDLLDNTRISIIHLDRRGRIMEANDRARRLLRHGDGITDDGGELQAGRPADRAQLARLVAAALPTSSAPAISGSMTLGRASEMPPFVVHVKPVVLPQPDYGARRVAALVLITEPGHQARLDPVLVAAALGLTPMESQVAIWVAEGRTVREIAAAIGRTPSSVHWHLRQIYQKHGITRHADLMRLVLSLTAFA